MSAILQPQSNTITAMIDRFGELETQLKGIDALIKERDSLRKQLAEQCDTIDPDGEVRLIGERFSVTFGKAPIQRTLSNLAGYLEAVGITKFLSSVKVSVSEADKYLNETQKAELFEVGKGSRRLKDCAPMVSRASEDEALARFYEALNITLGSITPKKH
jgi:glutamate-1-semialdehyde aminotransferase